MNECTSQVMLNKGLFTVNVRTDVSSRVWGPGLEICKKRLAFHFWLHFSVDFSLEGWEIKNLKIEMSDGHEL